MEKRKCMALATALSLLMAVALQCAEAQTANCTAYATDTEECLDPQPFPVDGLSCIRCDALCEKCLQSSSTCFACTEEEEEEDSGRGNSTDTVEELILLCNFDGGLPQLSTSLEISQCTRSPLSLGAIIGIGVGGGVLIILCLLFFCCCCVCCCRSKQHKKSFSPMPPEASEVTVQLQERFDQRADNNKETKQEVEVVSSIQKSASANSILVDSVAEQLQVSLAPPPKVGYVQMLSAGSVRTSKSTGDIEGSCAAAEELYSDADRRVLSAHFGTLESDQVVGQAALPEDDEDAPLDEYVDPQVFLEDSQMDRESDSYYNQEVVESLAKNTSESSALTADKENYQNIAEFVGTDTQATSYYNVMRKSEDETEYYNVTGERDSYAEVTEEQKSTGRRMSQDNQYIYMQSQAGSSEPAHKYVNLDRDSVADIVYGDGTEADSRMSVVEDSQAKAKPPIKETLVFPTREERASSTQGAANENNLYINVQRESIEDIYQNVSN